MEATIAVSTDFRNRWESKWERVIREIIPNLSLDERRGGEMGRELRYILNWLDWMGLMMKKKLIARDVILGTLRHTISEVLRETADIIQSEIDDKGTSWWQNVLYVAKLREVNIDISHEAKNLRQRWSAKEVK